MHRLLLPFLLVSCASTSPVDRASDASTDASEAGAAATDAAPVSPAAACASSFGSDLGTVFGKLDGVVTAIVGAADVTCASHRFDQVVIEVTSSGKVYPIVLDLSYGDGSDRDFRVAIVPHAGFSPWLAAWHTPATLDYVTMLGVHSDAFVVKRPFELPTALLDAIPIGAAVSVYATSSDGTTGTMVYRQGSGNDGAIVVHAERSPATWVLFHRPYDTF